MLVDFSYKKKIVNCDVCWSILAATIIVSGKNHLNYTNIIKLQNNYNVSIKNKKWKRYFYKKFKIYPK